MTDDHDDVHDDDGPGPDLVVCPECSAPAEVVDRFTLDSTDGPVAHVKILCLARHGFLLPVAALPRVPAVVNPRRTGPVR